MISNKDYHQGLLQYIGEDRKPNDDFAHDDWLSPMMMMMMMISCASLYIILNTGNKYSILAHDCLYIYIYVVLDFATIIFYVLMKARRLPS